jgi:hypothetical protein
MAADRAATMMQAIRAEHRVFEASRLRLVGLLDSTVGQYPAAGGNNLTDAYLDDVANGYDMTKAEWQAYWPTLRTAITITQANLTSLLKGLLVKT